MNYSEFLSRKAATIPCCGFSFEKENMNPSLFDWQKDIVCWALKKGKAALFENCGLGLLKEATQYESIKPGAG